MRRPWRYALGAALAAATLTAPPASAGVSIGVWHGTAQIACFGCGVSTGTAEIAFTGYALRPVVLGAAHASFTVNEPQATCPVTGTASGEVTGAVNVDFNWTRVGALAVYTTTGEVNGAGWALFVVTGPAGNPCGSPVTALVIGLGCGLTSGLPREA